MLIVLELRVLRLNLFAHGVTILGATGDRVYGGGTEMSRTEVHITKKAPYGVFEMLSQSITGFLWKKLILNIFQLGGKYGICTSNFLAHHVSCKKFPNSLICTVCGLKYLKKLLILV